MSENVNVSDDATADESVPCAESHESIQSDVTNNVEDNINCKNILVADVGEPIKNCEENNVDDKEIEIKNVEKPTDDKIIDVNSAYKLEQMDKNVIGSIHDALDVVVSDVQNKILDTNDVIEGIIDDTTQIVDKDIMGKLFGCLIIYFK